MQPDNHVVQKFDTRKNCWKGRCTQRGSSLSKAKLARQIEELRENGETACDDSNHSRYRLACCRNKLVWFLRRFCLKTVIDFAHFGLESGIATEVYKHICRSKPEC